MNRSSAIGVAVALGAAAFALGWYAGRQNSASDGDQAADQSAVVARIGTREIRASELKARIAEFGPMASARLSTLEGRRELLDQIVRTELWAQAGRAKGYDRDPKFRHRVSEALAEAYLERELQPRSDAVQVTDAELQERFAREKDTYSAPARVRIAQIFLSAPEQPAAKRAERRVEAEKVLQEVRHALAKDFHGFAPIARLRSEDTESRANSGELPALTRDELAVRTGPEVVQAAFSLTRPGELHGRVVETPAGFHIVRLIEQQAAATASLDTVRETLRAQLRQEKQQKLYDDLLSAVRAATPVEIDEAALKAL